MNGCDGPRFTQQYCDSLPKFDRSVSLVCWAYNEEQLVRDFLQRAHALMDRYVEDYEIVIVDDCSTDRTNQIVRDLAERMPQVHLIRNERNLNVGMSCRRAIAAAGKEYLFWQTIDWSYDINLLRGYLEMLRTHDVVAGVRRAPVDPVVQSRPVRVLAGLLKLFHVKHLTRRSDTLSKAIVSVLNYSLIRGLFNVPLSDYQNVVFYPTGLIQETGFESRSSFANPEALFKAHWRGASIVEVPINFLPREKGNAKGTKPSAILASLKDIFRLWFRWIILGRREHRQHGPIRRLDSDLWQSPHER